MCKLKEWLDKGGGGDFEVEMKGWMENVVL